MHMLYTKFKEQILYIIFGIFTTAVNFFTYALFTRIFNTEVLCATVVAWIISVVFAFITNKLYVFKSRNVNRKIVAKELCAFFTARILSVVLEVAIMYAFVEVMNYNDMLIKVIVNIIVIIINYILSKFWVFKKQKNGDEE